MKIGSYWVIRSKKTGDWLPELVKPLRGGYTHTEPCRNHTPRLFTTERGAKNALWWWLRGVVTVHFTAGDPMSDYGGTEPEEDWNTTAKPDRALHEMEVIQVVLSDLQHFDDGVTHD